MNIQNIPLIERTGGLIDWNRIPSFSIDHYLWLDNGYRPEVLVRMAYTSSHLHVAFRVYERSPTVRYSRLNEPVYKDSCVELFLQPDPASDPRYVNFEWNAAGVLLLGLGAHRGDRSYLSDVTPALFAVQTSVDVRENDAAGAERYFWSLQFAVPFDWLQSLFPGFRPDPGLRMRGNVYKCGNDTPHPHYGCWNRIDSDIPDFHRSEYFGQFVLAD